MSEDIPLQVPLFPLDGIVLFPGTVHHFHIFEERYKMLVGDVIEADGPLAVPLLKPNWEECYFEAPAVHRIAGMGRITASEQLEEGRRNITVEGICRIRLLREIRLEPYRVAEAEMVDDVLHSEDRDTIRGETARVGHLAHRLSELFPPFHQDLAPLTFDPAEASGVADQIANRFVGDVYDRQSILNEPNVCRRLQLTRVQLVRILQRFLREAEFRELMEALDGG